MLERSVEETAETLGPDAAAYRDLIGPLVPDDWDEVCASLRHPWTLAKYPFGLARFGLKAIRSSQDLTDAVFQGGRARALFSGLAAHSFLPLEQSPSAAFALVLGIAAHSVGWPIPRGGSQAISGALAAHLRSFGGKLMTGSPVKSLDELPAARAVLCDLTPRQLLRIAGERLPESYRRQLSAYRYGPAAFKLDYALDGPIPWRASECARAATVHVGGARAEIAASERAAIRGEVSEKPFVLVVQPSLFDVTRAPEGRHTAWAYCHVPNGSSVDMTERIETQIERFAPGFRDRILAHHAFSPAGLEGYNANYVGGDINGGLQDWRQMFTRPVAAPVPWATPMPGLYLCSSSTPPGGGVHGMCGYYAALAALRYLKACPD
jgi:phytoene dehydrogenase-like protein